ncbi:Ig-like domain repeat protein [Streptomyces sp. NPDC088354]|uniref:Ig-like domain repeat protein n=1 Tax=unclassified Streptomyces TaxID=2593676 RepID=UPI0029B07D36|nr:Ig-like domain repeat protein [Streptomyces sp. MI02-7b]MDX3073581.1 Ig-like domain repeat protein [Streptomyces sp. MI02-7b]
MRTRTASTALAVVFSSAALVAGTVSPAAADSSKALPIASYGDIAVDGAHKRVYISDPDGNKVVVTDYTGKPVATVPNLPGVRDLAITPDSRTVYAAVPGEDAVVAIETSTATAAAHYPTGENTDPQTLAVAGGRVWFMYGQQPSHHLGSFDPASGTPEIALDQLPGVGFYDAPELESAGNTLVIGVHGTWSGLAVYDVSSGAPVLRKQGMPAEADNYMSDFALSGDAKKIVAASGEMPYAATAINTDDLSRTGAYPVEAANPNSAAIAADGTIAVSAFSWYDKDIYVFKPGAKTPYRTYTYGQGTAGGDTIVGQGLAWAPDGSKLFALANGYSGTYLRVLDNATRYPVKATVSAPAKATRAKKLSVTGKLASAKSFPSGAKVTVTRTDIVSPKGKSLGTKTVSSSGAFSFTDIPPAGGNVTYTAQYAGDATHAPASGKDTVAVSRAATSLSLNHNGTLYAYGADVSFTAHLGSTYQNRTVQIWADPFGPDKPKKLVRTGKVNSKGNLSVTVDMTRDITVTAVFAGDARSASRTVTATAYAKVRVATTIAKQYKTAKIGSTSYAYFHKKTNPVFTTTMTYYKGRAQRLNLEFSYQGRWYDGGSQYFALGTNGKSVVTLTGTHETGFRMRVRSSYVNGSSGDTVNSTTYGAWKYFSFTT